MPDWQISHGLLIGTTTDFDDWCRRVESIRVRHGRTEWGVQPASATLTADLRDIDSTLLRQLHIGMLCIATARFVDPAVPEDQHSIVRFVGQITDIEWDGEEQTAQIIAADASATLQRKIIGDVPWPEEPDVSRARTILGAAGLYEGGLAGNWRHSNKAPGTGEFEQTATTLELHKTDDDGVDHSASDVSGILRVVVDVAEPYQFLADSFVDNGATWTFTGTMSGDAQIPANNALCALTVVGDSDSYEILGDTFVLVSERDVDRQQVWDLLADLADHTLGSAWVGTDGTVLFATHQWRVDQPPGPTLDTCVLNIQRRLIMDNNIVNWVWLNYFEVPQADSRDPASIDEHGVFEMDLNEGWGLAGLADHFDVANLLIQARAWPFWSSPQIVWTTDQVAGAVDDPTWEDISGPLLLQHGTRLQITGDVEGQPGGELQDFHVEGWDELMTAGTHSMVLAVTDRWRIVEKPLGSWYLGLATYSELDETTVLS